MNQDDIELTLPAPQLVATIGPTMSPDEEAAREKTLTTALRAISKEAAHLMEQEGADAYAQAISQAWGYTNTMITRRGYVNRANPGRPDTGLAEACLTAQKSMAGEEADRINVMEQTLSEELTEDEETDGLAHGAAAALLGAHAALRQHVRGIARGDEMSAGHSQAAVGLKVTIEHLAETMELRHEEHCHHCGTIDRAYEGADAARTLMNTMRPAIRELTQVRLHPSLVKNDGTEDEAQSLAESTIDLFGSFQLFLQGDPASPESSLHSFYLDGTLHVKRLTDPFPKGMNTPGASTIAETTRALAEAHAQDHAEGFADLVTGRAREMELEADCGLHTATAEEINHYLETLADTTPHPATQADAVTALTGDRALAERIMARRPDLFSASHARATGEPDGRSRERQPPTGDGGPHKQASLQGPGGAEPETRAPTHRTDHQPDGGGSSADRRRDSVGGHRRKPGQAHPQGRNHQQLGRPIHGRDQVAPFNAGSGGGDKENHSRREDPAQAGVSRIGNKREIRS